MKKVYLIPNAITAFGLTCGLFVIFKTSIADPSKNLFLLLQASAILILVAAVADLADGLVARLIKAESEFGTQFDALADCVTFGVTPPLIVLKSLTWGGAIPSRLLSFFVILAALIYSLCGVLRLVRFNVRSKQIKDSADLKKKLEEKKHFTGLPIPAAAAAAISASLLLVSPFAELYFPLSSDIRSLILGSVLIVIGYFMISRWKFPSVKAFHFRVPSIYLVFATGLFAVIILYGIMDFFAEAFFLVSWLYLAISWTFSIIRLIAGKRSKALADFEPEQDDSDPDDSI